MIDVTGLLLEGVLPALQSYKATFVVIIRFQDIDEGLSFYHLVREQVLNSLITQLAR